MRSFDILSKVLYVWTRIIIIISFIIDVIYTYDVCKKKVLLWKDYKSKFTECLKTEIFKEKNKWKYLFCGSKYMKPYQH